MTDGQTQIPRITDVGTQGSTTQEDIVERLEVLTNQTGQLNKESQNRATKYNIQIRDLGDTRYTLKEAIFVTVEEYSNEDTLLITYPELEVFGEGVTESDAILNLKFAILDLYDELIGTPEAELGEVPLSWLNVLKKIIVVN